MWVVTGLLTRVRYRSLDRAVLRALLRLLTRSTMVIVGNRWLSLTESTDGNTNPGHDVRAGSPRLFGTETTADRWMGGPLINTAGLARMYRLVIPGSCLESSSGWSKKVSAEHAEPKRKLAGISQR